MFCAISLLVLLICVTITEVCGDYWFHCGSACFNFELICDGWRQCIPTNDEECSEFIDKHNLQHIILDSNDGLLLTFVGGRKWISYYDDVFNNREFPCKGLASILQV